MQENKQTVSIIVVAIVVIIIIAVIAIFNKNKVNIVKQGFYEGQMTLEKMSEISFCPLTSDKDAFAKCLTEKGWVMYGAAWCSHCVAQKALFGTSFQFIKYVECPDNIQLCTDKGVNGYPTWVVEK